MKYCFGVDIGGTTVKMGLFEEDGKILDKWEIVTDTSEEGKAVLPNIASSIEAKIEEHNLDKRDILGIGAGVPAPVNSEGIVNGSANLGWKYKEVKREFEELTGVTSYIGNDANVAALGEMWKGGGEGGGADKGENHRERDEEAPRERRKEREEGRGNGEEGPGREGRHEPGFRTVAGKLPEEGSVQDDRPPESGEEDDVEDPRPCARKRLEVHPQINRPRERERSPNEVSGQAAADSRDIDVGTERREEKPKEKKPDGEDGKGGQKASHALRCSDVEEFRCRTASPILVKTPCLHREKHVKGSRSPTIPSLLTPQAHP